MPKGVTPKPKPKPTCKKASTVDRLDELCNDHSFDYSDAENPKSDSSTNCKSSNEVGNMIAGLDAQWKHLDDLMNQCTKNLVRTWAPAFKRMAQDKDKPIDPSQMNGLLADKTWDPPTLAVESNTLNRKDLGGNITASEYLDTEATLQKKVNLFANLLKRSKHTCAYCGAGLSRSAGISDYATKSENSLSPSGNKPLSSPTDALPTVSHHILTAFHDAGYIHSFIQQNHDGLPQKAGFPQSKINEIHGGWYDPSNTVVPMSGQLRKDLSKWLCDIEEKTTLTLCLGTSLSGMTSDRLATTPAMRADDGEPDMIGTVIVNLQRTRVDEECCLRVWSTIEKFMILLANALGVKYSVQPVKWPTHTNTFQVPYNAAGQRDENSSTTIDLTYGKRVIISHPNAANLGHIGVVIGRDKLGHWIIAFPRKLLKGTVQRKLGAWWMQDALHGVHEYLPVVNAPELGKAEEKEK